MFLFIHSLFKKKTNKQTIIDYEGKFWLDNKPGLSPPPSHWKQLVIYLPNPRKVHKGENIKFTFFHDDDDIWLAQEREMEVKEVVRAPKRRKLSQSVDMPPPPPPPEAGDRFRNVCSCQLHTMWTPSRFETFNRDCSVGLVPLILSKIDHTNAENDAAAVVIENPILACVLAQYFSEVSLVIVNNTNGMASFARELFLSLKVNQKERQGMIDVLCFVLKIVTTCFERQNFGCFRC